MRFYLTALVYCFLATPMAQAINNGSGKSCAHFLRSSLGKSRFLVQTNSSEGHRTFEANRNINFRIIYLRYDIHISVKVDVFDNKLRVTQVVEPSGGRAEARELMLRSFKGGVRGLNIVLATNDDSLSYEWLDKRTVEAIDLLNFFLNSFRSSENLRDNFMQSESWETSKNEFRHVTIFDASMPENGESRNQFLSSVSVYLLKVRDALKAFPGTLK